MGRSFLGKTNGGFGGVCPKGLVEHVLEWGYTCNLSRWLLSALLEPQSSSQLTKFKLSRQLKIWFPKNSWILACKPSDKTSLGLHAKIYNFFGEWKKMQTQQQPYPGTADATIKIMHPSLGLAQLYPGTADATIRIMHPSLGLAQPYPGTADATIRIMHPSLGLAQPYPGTADATIKIMHPSLGLAQPYPGTADATIKIMHPSLGLAQPYPGTADATIKIGICHLDLHDRTRVRSCKPKWQMPTVRGYSRRNGSKWRGAGTRLTSVMCIHRHQETTLIHTLTREKAAVWGRGPLSRVF